MRKRASPFCLVTLQQEKCLYGIALTSVLVASHRLFAQFAHDEIYSSASNLFRCLISVDCRQISQSSFAIQCKLRIKSPPLPSRNKWKFSCHVWLATSDVRATSRCLRWYMRHAIIQFNVQRQMDKCVNNIWTGWRGFSLIYPHAACLRSCQRIREILICAHHFVYVQSSPFDSNSNFVFNYKQMFCNCHRVHFATASQTHSLTRFHACNNYNNNHNFRQPITIFVGKLSCMHYRKWDSVGSRLTIASEWTNDRTLDHGIWHAKCLN